MYNANPAQKFCGIQIVVNVVNKIGIFFPSGIFTVFSF